MRRVFAVLDLLPHLLAVAGGGSSGFGGGGGGGGGFSGGGGSSGGGGEMGTGGWIVFGLVVLFVLGALVVGAIQAARMRRRRRERVARVTTASAEAASDDAHFAAETVVAEARDLFLDVQRAWSKPDLHRLRALVGPDLMVEWERRLADFAAKGWRNEVTVTDGPDVEYVGLVNREDDTEDRVVVRISATVDDKCVTRTGETILRNGAKTASTRIAEWWTLQRRDDAWRLASIEADSEGVHHLDAPIVASPWDDTLALRDEALVEGAVADAAPAGFAPSELVDVDLAADARAQAMDLALVDGRFAPDVLEVAARRAVAAWGEAIDGEDDALLAVAEPGAARALLHGADGSARTRVVVRGAHVERIGIDRLAPGAEGEPARMTVTVAVRARRYVEDRDTAAVLEGSKDAERTFTESWTLALTGDAANPWRLVAVAQPVAG